MKKLIFIFLLFIYSNAFSEMVNNLEVVGNKRISSETIKVYGEIDLKKNYTEEDVNEVLKNLYSTNFFENVEVNINNNIIKIIVKEYPLIYSIKINGEKTNKIKDAILERLTSKEKESFIKNNLAKDINTIKNIYKTMGFNFTEVDAKTEDLSENRLNLVFYLDKGEKTKISKINFIGDKKIKDRRLRDIIVSQEDKFWKFITKNTNLNNNNVELDKRLLKNYYKSLGYYDVQVISSNAEINENNETVLTFNINAGTRYKIKKISTNVDKVIDKKIFIPLNKEFTKYAGKYYSPFSVKKLLDQVDLLIANNDLQFIEHSVNEIIDPDGIEIKINIYEGSKVLVERINVKGNTITNEAVVRGELLLDEGDPFSSLKLDQSIAKIKARDIFGTVTKTINQGSSNNTKIIDIEVEEKPTGEISAGAGVGTNGGSLAFSISENNWLGRGLKVETFAEIDEETFKGALQVRDPNYGFKGNELKYHVSSTSNDKPDSGYKNRILSTGIGTKFEQYKDIYLSPGISLNHDDLEVQSTASKQLKKQAGTFTDLAFDYAIQKDNRDRKFMPTDGSIVQFGQLMPVYADSLYIRNTFAYNAYNTFSPDLIGAFKFYATSVNSIDSDDVRLSKRIYLPSKRLRGFEAGKFGPKDSGDYVGGNYATTLSFETNLPNLLPESTRTDIGLFLDIGNLWGVDYDSSIDDSNVIRSSVGVNTNWLSPIGPMSFVLSQNLSKASTDLTESFNFRLGTTF